MREFEDRLLDISKKPSSYIILFLDICRRIFGVFPCLATGVRCYNTWITCKHKPAFSLHTTPRKIYLYSININRPIYLYNELDPVDLEGSFWAFPFLEKIKYLSLEIKERDLVSGRVIIDLVDDYHNDLYFDLYRETRTLPIKGFFWKKLLERYHYFFDRDVMIYDGFAESKLKNYVKVFEGKISKIKVKKQGIQIEIEDNLKKLMKTKFYEEVISFTLMGDMNVEEEALHTAEDIKSLSADAETIYVKVDEEIMMLKEYPKYVSPKLVSIVRGCFGTEIEEHKAGTKGKFIYYYFDYPINILKHLLAKAKVQYVFDFEENLFPENLRFMSLLDDMDTKIFDEIFSICELLGIRYYSDEAGKIRFKVLQPYSPVAERIIIDDNYIIGQPDFEYNYDYPKSRAEVYWNRIGVKSLKSDDSYAIKSIFVNADVEGKMEFNKILDSKFLVKWIYDIMEYGKSFIEGFGWNYLRRRDKSIINFYLNIPLEKMTIKIGDKVSLSTDALVDIYGNEVKDREFWVTKKERLLDKVKVSFSSLNFEKRYGFIGNFEVDYGVATEYQKKFAFICDDTGKMPDGTEGYRVF